MKQYKEIFERVIKGASSKAGCIDEKLGLWIVPHKEKNILFYGYDFGLNRSNVETVCKDKYLTWILLNENKKTNRYNSPLEMKFFNAYNRKKLNFSEPLSNNLYKSINEKKTLVLSFTDRWGEKDIYKVATKPQVDNALQKLGLKNYFLSTNFMPVSQEYRVILGRFGNDVELLLCLQKEPLKIKGDGEKTINQLVLEKLVDLREGVELEEVWKDVNTQLSLFKLKFNDVLSLGKEIDITWRLNRNIGAKLTAIDKNDIPEGILDIAQDAFQTLNMNFGCVDIAKCEENGKNKYLIMGLKTQVLTDLLEHCKYEELVEMTKKVIKECAKSYEMEEEFNDVKISEINEEDNPKEDIDISTYKGRSRVRKDCIKRISEKLRFNTKFYSQDYLAVINDNIFMVEFDMGINNSSSVFACGDKGATPKILRFSEVPCVTHEVFSLSERDEDNENGVMEEILKKFNEWNRNVVLKMRRGGQGVGLYHIKNEIDLEKALLKEIKNDVVLSPYLNIINEYRVLVLSGNILCIYKKNRLHVRGDDKSSLSQLVNSQIKDGELRNNIMEDLVSEGVNLNQIVPNNEKYLVTWKHNLSYGATPEISKDHEINKKLSDIAKNSAQAIGANFVAVDIVDTVENNLCVLEINSFPGFYHFVKIYGRDNLNILLEKLLSETLRMSQPKQSEKLLTEQLEEKVEIIPPFLQEKK